MVPASARFAIRPDTIAAAMVAANPAT